MLSRIHSSLVCDFEGKNEYKLGVLTENVTIESIKDFSVDCAPTFERDLDGWWWLE